MGWREQQRGARRVGQAGAGRAGRRAGRHTGWRHVSTFSTQKDFRIDISALINGRVQVCRAI